MEKSDHELVKSILRSSKFQGLDPNGKAVVLQQIINNGISQEELDRLFQEVIAEKESTATFRSIVGDIIFKLIEHVDYHDVVSLCSVDMLLREFCKKNKEIIWRYLTSRDYPKAYKAMNDPPNQINNWEKYYRYLVYVTSPNHAWLNQIKSRSVRSDLNQQLTEKWTNPSGLFVNTTSGWSLRKDVNNSNIAYFYPASYNSLGRNIKAKEGENHPRIVLRIIFDRYNKVITIDEIPWNDTIRKGEYIVYRRGDGKVSWFDDSYLMMMTFDGLDTLQFKLFWDVPPERNDMSFLN